MSVWKGRAQSTVQKQRHFCEFEMLGRKLDYALRSLWSSGWVFIIPNRIPCYSSSLTYDRSHNTQKGWSINDNFTTKFFLDFMLFQRGDEFRQCLQFYIEKEEFHSHLVSLAEHTICGKHYWISPSAITLSHGV